MARVLGAATAAYGAATLVAPAVLARPTGLVDGRGRVGWRAAVLVRALGVRDALSGVSMVLAPGGPPLRLALLLRAGADLGDAAVFGLSLRDGAARRQAAAVASTWGVLNLAALARERGRLR